MYILKGLENNGVYPIEDDFGNTYHFTKKEVIYMLKKGIKIKGMRLKHGEIVIEKKNANGISISTTYLDTFEERSASLYEM